MSTPNNIEMSNSTDNTNTIVLVASDGTIISDIPRYVIKYSILLKNISEFDDLSEKTELPNIDDKSLRVFVEFCKMYENDIEENKNKVANIPMPILSTKMSKVVPEQYAKLLEVSLDNPEIKLKKQDVMDILLGANYIGATLLVNLTCATIASWAKCKTPEELLVEFDVVDKITPEMEAMCRKEINDYELTMEQLKKDDNLLNYNPESMIIKS
jgi:hypothetical protein